jgi:hypothetical protein
MQTIDIENGTQLGFDDLLKVIQKLDNQSLSKFAIEVNQLVSKRNNNAPFKREADLLKQIKTVIPISIKKRQKQLYEMLHQGTITPKERDELLLLNDKLEEKAAERIHLMGELAVLKGIPIQELAAQL